MSPSSPPQMPPTYLQAGGRQPASRWASALRWGALFGAIGFVIILLNGLLLTFLVYPALVRRAQGGFGETERAVINFQRTDTIITIIIGLALSFFAGLLAARASRSAGAGALAALLARLISYVAGAIATLVVFAVELPHFVQIDGVRLLLLGVPQTLVFLLFYVGVGFVGGLIGRGQATPSVGAAPPPSAYAPYGYPGGGAPYPPAAYPPYPQPGAYPQPVPQPPAPPDA